MKGNKKITWALMVSLIAIWGSIAYQLVEAVDKTDDEEIETGYPRESAKRSAEKFTFNDNVRDPFKYVNRSESKEPKPVQQSVLWVPPPFRLTGIVVNDKEKMAVLEGPDGATYFVSEGETLIYVK